MGFEPTIPLRVCRISSAVPSTTRPPLRSRPRPAKTGPSVGAGVIATAAHQRKAVSRRDRRRARPDDHQSVLAPKDAPVSLGDDLAEHVHVPHGRAVGPLVDREEVLQLASVATVSPARPKPCHRCQVGATINRFPGRGRWRRPAPASSRPRSSKKPRSDGAAI